MPGFDPRVTPARRDLAAKELEGKVAAARYVDGQVYEVIEAQAPLRSEPRPDAELATEALKGERVTIYDTNAEGWAWGKLAADGPAAYDREARRDCVGARRVAASPVRYVVETLDRRNERHRAGGDQERVVGKLPIAHRDEARLDDAAAAPDELGSLLRQPVRLACVVLPGHLVAPPENP